MKKLLLILTISTTLNTYAQINTSGGPPVGRSGPRLDESETETEGATEKLSRKRFEELTKILLRIEKECTKTRQNSKPGHTFLQSYSELSMLSFFQFTNISPFFSCEQGQVQACLQDKELRKLLFVIKSDPGSYKYLSSKHSIGKEEASQIFNFLSNYEKYD